MTYEILELIQKARKDFGLKNPYDKERQQLLNWKEKSREEILENISDLFLDIGKVYTEKEFEIAFYQKTALNEHFN